MALAPKTWIVVPCFNEAARFHANEFEEFGSEHPDVRFVFVDDGSTDGTLELLQDLATRCPDACGVLALPANVGKAEAVRAGMNRAFSEGAVYAGYWDADLATPLDEIPSFVDELDAHPALELLLGSRVKLLGRSIERLASRHYLGRVSATAISLALRLPVYDTQCGAKLFRATPESKALFGAPFRTRWIFDVEILARMLDARRDPDLPRAEEAIREMPLWQWRDVGGSKVKPIDFFKSMLELSKIRRRDG